MNKFRSSKLLFYDGISMCSRVNYLYCCSDHWTFIREHEHILNALKKNSLNFLNKIPMTHLMNSRFRANHCQIERTN